MEFVNLRLLIGYLTISVNLLIRYSNMIPVNLRSPNEEIVNVLLITNSPIVNLQISNKKIVNLPISITELRNLKHFDKELMNFRIIGFHTKN